MNCIPSLNESSNRVILKQENSKDIINDLIELIVVENKLDLKLLTIANSTLTTKNI